MSIAEGDSQPVVIHCQAGCSTDSILAALGLTWSDLLNDLEQSRKDSGKAKPKVGPTPARPTPRQLFKGESIEAVYDYHDENGKVLYRVCRTPQKEFPVARPDPRSRTGWYWGRGKVRPVLYRLPALLSVVESGGTVFIVEGEKDADTINNVDPDRTDFVATTAPGGAGNWKPQYAEVLSGAARVVVWRDKDEPGGKHAEEIAASLRDKVQRLEIVESKIGKDAADHLAAGCSLDNVIVVEAPLQPTSLEETIATFRRWQLMPDPGALLVVLGAYAANQLPGDPVWLLVVGPASSGKTEKLWPLAALPDVHPTSTLTEASLLSGTSRREKAKDAKGGLLRTIGEQGIILCKDFGSVLSLHRDARAAVLAALREVYDGSYTRHVGTDGGKTLSWSGRVGLIAACTPTIDRHQSVMAAMGERFVIYRMPELDRDAVVRVALGHAGRESAMRRELSEAVRGLFSGLTLPDAPGELSEDDLDHLIALSKFVAQARAPVERDGYKREIELIPGAEAPTRISITLKRLLDGLGAIGADRAAAWVILEKVALDCLPMIRRRVIEQLATVDGEALSTTELTERLGYPTQTARRALEDLTVYRLVDRESRGRGQADTWRESEWLREVRTQAFRTVPEMSGGVQAGGVPEKSDDILPLYKQKHTFDDFSGKVPLDPEKDRNDKLFSDSEGVPEGAP